MAAAAFRPRVGEALRDSTELLHEKMKDAMLEMTCQPAGLADSMADLTCRPVGTAAKFEYGCAIRRCRQGCSHLKKIPGENVFDDDTPENMITWHQHAYVSECTKHGLIGRDTGVPKKGKKRKE